MTKKHVPVYLNELLVGRAEIFDLEGSIRIIVSNDKLISTLMTDAVSELSIGWTEFVVVSKPRLNKLQIANFSMRGHIAMCDDCYRCFNMFDHDKTVLYGHGLEHGADSTVITVVSERDPRR